MRNFPPIQSPNHVNIVYAEDSEYEAVGTIAGLQWLVGVPPENITHFTELDDAAHHIENLNKRQPTVAIFDNNTPRSGWKGHQLAKSLLRKQNEYPNLDIVTVSSSDMGLVFDNAGREIDEIQKLGGEFWAKHSDGNLMLLWLGESLRTGTMPSRVDWLNNLGIESQYQTAGQDRLPQDWAIYQALDALTFPSVEDHRGQEQNILAEYKLKVGDFFYKQPEIVLSNLGFPPPSSLERPSSAKR